MDDWLTLLIRAFAGGLLVVAFAILSEAVKPKRFAGLFSAAPAVAIAGLVVTLSTTGSPDAKDGALGMLAGAGGMVAYSAVVVALLRRQGPHVASATAMVVWFAVGGALAIPMLA
jgi:uncharacterized membrane protein (GlpM family)